MPTSRISSKPPWPRQRRTGIRGRLATHGDHLPWPGSGLARKLHGRACCYPDPHGRSGIEAWWGNGSEWTSNAPNAGQQPTGRSFLGPGEDHFFAYPLTKTGPHWGSDLR